LIQSSSLPRSSTSTSCTDLRGTAVLDVRDVRAELVIRGAAKLVVGVHQGHGVLVVGDDVVHVEAEGSVGDLRQLDEERQRAVDAALVAGIPAPAPDMPDDIGLERAAQRVEVTGAERLVAAPEKGRIGVFRNSRHALRLLRN